ncbi:MULTISPECIES: Dyp-type peroxidase [unclassified Pseudomonas]|jgi:putative iron-dependent peroxidase|uniref:Dyp-type peroxidase n=1 Tax=unclassified Pseudomonas TaxID=196821 RepID=UPI0007306921|nr:MULTISPECIES: Dyp-type peroxidase [unclassified Pseudomonas]KSW22160.1 peroxidase [Pseudomonas sp. ADP]OBP10393.1 peroxidase [Pseudomonas sp. EGD-AKN5]QOF84950.1 Dyp-type peroxidase [Pseudomonas sp. ADPe]
MSLYQPGILATPVPAQARHLFFDLQAAEHLPAALDRLLQLADGESAVVGFGASLVRVLGRQVEGLREFPALSGAGVDNPSTQHALWVWLRGEDRGDLLLRTHALERELAPALTLVEQVEAFRHGAGLDLTGYEDGTENPQDEDAVDAAVVAGAGAGLDGGSFAAIQQWRHQLQAFAALPQAEQDDIIGRRKSDNEELDEAPESAHVKRTAQESFEPEAFVVRRSMPWTAGAEAGLMFLAFGRSLDAFEAQLRRMSGLDDGIVDALYRFSRPLTGGYYWCPPRRDDLLDLGALLG